MKTPSTAACLAFLVLLGPASFLRAEPGEDPHRAASEAFAEGRAVDAAAPDAPRELKELLEQAAEVQRGRDPADPLDLFASAIGVVSDKLKLDGPAKQKALDLYLGRIRTAGETRSPAQLALMSRAADKYLREPGIKPEAAARATRRMEAYARALGGLADDGSTGAAAGGPGKALGPAELAALARVPRARVTSDMTRIRDVAAPEIEPAEPGLALRGVADLQRSEAIADDGAVGTWLFKKGLMAGGVGKVIGGKLSEPQTYSDWWRDAGAVARGFTPSTGFVSVREGPGAVVSGGKAIVLGVAHDFKHAYDEARAYVKAPTAWNGLELTAAIGMVGFNAVGFGAPAAAKTAVIAEAKVVVKAVAKEVVKDAAELGVMDAVRVAAKTEAAATKKAATTVATAAKAEAEAAAKARIRGAVTQKYEDKFAASVRELGKDPAKISGAERKALVETFIESEGLEGSAIAAGLRPPVTVQSKLISEYSQKYGLSEATVEKALADHVAARDFSLKQFESLSERQQTQQIRLQLEHPDFIKQPGIADQLKPKIVGFDQSANASAQAAFARSPTYGKLVVVDGGAFEGKLFRHIGSDELSRAIAERGLVAKGFKERALDFDAILQKAKGAEGLVINRVIDNPAAKSVLYEFTEHAERSGLGAAVATAGPIKIQIIPRPGQKFISTNVYGQRELGKNEMGWATMDPIAIEQIIIHGAGCPAGCRLASTEGMALARMLVPR